MYNLENTILFKMVLIHTIFWKEIFWEKNMEQKLFLSLVTSLPILNIWEEIHDEKRSL